MTYPLIFPSLSRQPSMDVSKSTEDDTIKDQAESGYVSTRPRFTRARRTWKINVRNLVEEDVRALDAFFMSTSARGANSFLYPNLLPNGSFEFLSLIASDLVQGWSASGAPAQEAIGIGTAAVADGTQAISFSTVATKTIAANITAVGALACDQATPCIPGETYVFTGAVNAVQGTLAAGVLAAQVCVTYYDASGAVLSTANGSTANIGVGWQAYGFQFTVPANAATFRVSLLTMLINSSSGVLTLDGSSSVTWDTVACALLTPLTPFGRMAGSQPLGCLVRFSKLPEVSDIGWGNGVKRYGASFELTEV